MTNKNEKHTQWAVGYKELKNFLHNEKGITSEHIQEMFQEIAREELIKAVGENGEFILQAMKDIVREEMITALQAEGYPIVKGNMHYHHKDERNPFHKYVSQIMKEEIISVLRKQIEVGVQINTKPLTPMDSE